MLRPEQILAGPRGSYRIERVLRAAGQMLTARAVVVEGDQPDQAVVLKQLRIDGVESWKALELFERETAVLRQLDHDQLPRLIDAFARDDDSGSSLYLVCSWAEGESLLDKLDTDWKPTETEIWDIARQSLELLDYLHHFNPPIIHRDLKPGNLILAEDGQLSLVDLGSVQGCLNPDGGSTVVGTFGYMPPEQFSDRCVPASDIYALGATLVHLLTGKFPSDLPRKGMKLDYESLLSCHTAYRTWLDQLLDPIVEKRFQSASEALKALDEAQDLAGGKSSALALSRGDDGDPTASRIEALQRGAGLRLVIRPPALRHDLGFTGMLGLSLCLIWLCEHPIRDLILSLLVTAPGTEAAHLGTERGWEGAAWMLVWQHGIALLGAALLGQRLLSRLQTTLLLQPDRFAIRSVMPWRARKPGRIRQGALTEIVSLRARFDWLRLRPAVSLVERSGLAHPGPVGLQRAQRLALLSRLHDYLNGSDPAQASRLLETSLRQRQRPSLLLPLQAFYHSLRQNFGPGARTPGPDAQALTATGCIRATGTDDGALSLSIAPRRPGLAVLAPLLPLGLLDWVFLPARFQQRWDEIEAYNHWVRSFPLMQRQLVDAQQFGWGWLLENWLLLGIVTALHLIACRWALQALNGAMTSTSLSLNGQRLEVRHRRWGRETSAGARLDELVDLSQGARWSPGGKSLYAWTADGRRLILGHRLNTPDTLELVGRLMPRLQQSVNPVLRQLLPGWQAYARAWQRQLDGDSDRIRIRQAQDEVRIDIEARDLKGHLILLFFLGQLLAMTGLWHLFESSFVQSAAPLNLILSPLLQLFPLQAYNLTYCLAYLVGTASLLTLGGSLMLHSFFQACVRTRLRIHAGRVEVQHSLPAWRQRYELPLAGLSIRPSADPASLSLNLGISAGGKRRIAAYGLTPKGLAALSAELAAASSQLPEAAPAPQPLPAQPPRLDAPGI